MLLACHTFCCITQAGHCLVPWFPEHPLVPSSLGLESPESTNPMKDSAPGDAAPTFTLGNCSGRCCNHSK